MPGDVTAVIVLTIHFGGMDSVKGDAQSPQL
jgi:hypothetical protein